MLHNLILGVNQAQDFRNVYIMYTWENYLFYFTLHPADLYLLQRTLTLHFTSSVTERITDHIPQENI